MKILSKIITLFVGIAISTHSVGAIDAPSNVQLDNSTSTSLSLSWSTTEEGFVYYDIYFSDIQNFEIINAQKIEFNESNSVILNNLEPATQYYVKIAATNEELEKSELSQEYIFSTLGENAIEFNSAEEFKISTIEVLAKNQISVAFTSPLQNGDNAERLFRVLERDNEFEEYYILESKIDEDDNRKVIITFESNLPIQTNYKLIALSIFDQGGRNIQSGIESFENFYIEEEIKNKYYNIQTDIIEIVDENGVVINSIDNQTVEEEPTEEESIEKNIEEEQVLVEGENNQVNDSTQVGLNAADNLMEEEKVEGEKIEGVIKEDVYSAGQSAETLPTTGPTHILMLLIAVMLGGMAFVYRFKK